MSDEPIDKPKKSKAKWIIILLLLIILGGAGYFAYTKFFAGGDKGADANATDAAESTEMAPPPTPGTAEHVVLDPFLVNLADPLGRRYLKLTLDVEVNGPDAAKMMRDLTPKVRDRVILLLSSKTYADLSTLENKITLKEEIVERLNQVLGGAYVLQVYFTEMVIQ